jgi:uncharacterized protein
VGRLVKGTNPLRVDVADLLRRSGRNRVVEAEAVLDGLRVVDTRVPEGAPVTVAVRLESLNDGILARGTVGTRWVGECRRCARPVDGELSAPVLEVFEARPTEGETYPLVDGFVDLEPMAREAVLLELPLAPLCADDCAGLCPECGADRNEGPCGCAPVAADPRWAVLADLELEE